MFQREGHMISLREYLQHILLGVFATQTEEHTGIMLRAHEFLERPPRRIDLDPPGPILAANSLPQGLIAVQGDHFAGSAPNSVDTARERRAQGREEQRRVWDVPELVRPWIVDRIHTAAGG